LVNERDQRQRPNSNEIKTVNIELLSGRERMAHSSDSTATGEQSFRQVCQHFRFWVPPTTLRRMSNRMDRYLLPNVPDIPVLKRTTAQTVEARIDEAIQRMQIAVSDSYDSVSLLSIYWKSDDTSGREDSSLFIDTLSKLQNVKSCQRSLDDDAMSFTLVGDIAGEASQSGRRKLFILYYAGHALV
jgi:hypothetical protein